MIKIEITQKMKSAGLGAVLNYDSSDYGVVGPEDIAVATFLSMLLASPLSQRFELLECELHRLADLIDRE